MLLLLIVSRTYSMHLLRALVARKEVPFVISKKVAIFKKFYYIFPILLLFFQ